MGRNVPHQPFQRFGHFPQFAVRPFLNHGSQFRHFFKRVIQRNFGLAGNHFGDTVHFWQGNFQNSSHIPQSRFGRHGSKGGDGSHPIPSVSFGHVAQNFSPAAVAHIHINIGRAYPLGVDESFKQKVVANRVHVGDAGHIRNQTTRRRTAARAHRYIFLTGLGDKIPHN